MPSFLLDCYEQPSGCPKDILLDRRQTAWRFTSFPKPHGCSRWFTMGWMLKAASCGWVFAILTTCQREHLAC